MNEDFKVGDNDLIQNPTARVPVVLCLDTSGSMTGRPIRELTDGVNLFHDSVRQDDIARYAAEISVVSFSDGEARCHSDFANVDRYKAIELEAYGDTPMGKGVWKAMDMLEDRKSKYKAAGVDYFQPWLVLMTDGAPTESIDNAVRRVGEQVSAKRLSVFAIGIGVHADMNVLARFSPNRSPLRLKGLEFGKFFEWLSQSVQRVSTSMPGEAIKLDQEGIHGWGEV